MLSPSGLILQMLLLCALAARKSKIHHGQPYPTKISNGPYRQNQKDIQKNGTHLLQLPIWHLAWLTGDPRMLHPCLPLALMIRLNSISPGHPLGHWHTRLQFRHYSLLQRTILANQMICIWMQILLVLGQFHTLHFQVRCSKCTTGSVKWEFDKCVFANTYRRLYIRRLGRAWPVGTDYMLSDIYQDRTIEHVNK